MKIQQLESFLTNAGVRNYLFVRLTADNGMTGIGEASLEWQEKAVQTLLHKWVEHRILDKDPFDIEAIVGGMLRDQYQGGPTVLTAISGVEIAMWDLVGKACGQPLYRLLGGRVRQRLPAYANGWYGGAATPAEFADRAREVVERGYRALKFDPFGTAWKEMTVEEMDLAEARVAEVRRAVGQRIDVLIEGHGRLSAPCAIHVGLRLARYQPTFFEEPVTPHSLELLQQVQRALPFPLAAGERLYALEDFYRFTMLRPADVLQPDLCHIGGLHVGKKVAAMAQAQDIRLALHVSIGPVALCAALHFGWSTPAVWMQEDFSAYDVPWRKDFVCGWEPTQAGTFRLPDGVGLGIELDTAVCQAHPYVEQAFPSLWEHNWVAGFTPND